MRFVFDGSMLLHEAKSVIKSPDWQQISESCIKSLISKASKLTETKPHKIYFLLDDQLPEFRTKLLGNYKIDRRLNLTDEQVLLENSRKEARDFLYNILPSVGIVCIKSIHGEADDLAYWLTKKYDEGYLISTDRDWMINISGDWKLLRHRTGEVLTEDDFMDEWGSCRRYCYYRAMIGGRTPPLFSKKVAKAYSSMLITEDIEDLPEELVKVIPTIKSYYTMYSPEWVSACHEIHTEVDTEETRTSTNVTQMDWLNLCFQLNSTNLSVWWNRLKPLL